MVLDSLVARKMRDGLSLLLQRQCEAVAAVMPARRGEGRTRAKRGEGSTPDARGHRAALTEDLDLLRTWFDPVAKGEKVRAAVAVVPVTHVDLPFDRPPLVVALAEGARIVTPEGRVLLYCLNEVLSPAEGESAGHTVRLRGGDIEYGIDRLLQVYQTWTRQRLNDVVGLLQSETSTLRPAAAGLLFFLVLNRNTAPERALRRPKVRRGLEVVSDAVHRVAGTYASTLTGRVASERATDLYRGWALGELRRRLGRELNASFEEGIWLSENGTKVAVSRLREDILRRRGPGAERARQAVHASVDEYGRCRNALAGLGLAYERPTATLALVEALLKRADGEADGE